MTKKSKEPSFKQAFERLEVITGDLESESLDLDASIKKFEEGLKIAESLKKRLEMAKNKITVLKKDHSA